MNFVILTTLFVVAILGFVQSHRDDPDDVAQFGLSGLGVGLIAVATLGFVAGLVRKYREGKSAKEAERREEQTMLQLGTILAELDGLQKSSADPEVSEQIGKVVEGLSSVASLRRYSDFRMSDFSGSNFARARFSDANFDQASFDGAFMRDAIFPSADLSGANLSAAVTDEGTRLPVR